MKNADVADWRLTERVCAFHRRTWRSSRTFASTSSQSTCSKAYVVWLFARCTWLVGELLTTLYWLFHSTRRTMPSTVCSCWTQSRISSRTVRSCTAFSSRRPRYYSHHAVLQSIGDGSAHTGMIGRLMATRSAAVALWSTVATTRRLRLTDGLPSSSSTAECTTRASTRRCMCESTSAGGQTRLADRSKRSVRLHRSRKMRRPRRARRRRRLPVSQEPTVRRSAGRIVTATRTTRPPRRDTGRRGKLACMGCCLLLELNRWICRRQVY